MRNLMTSLSPQHIQLLTMLQDGKTIILESINDQSFTATKHSDFIYLKQQEPSGTSAQEMQLDSLQFLITKYGIISKVFSQDGIFLGSANHQLIHHPLMEFINNQDLTILCIKLAALKSSYDTCKFAVRWQEYSVPSSDMNRPRIDFHTHIESIEDLLESQYSFDGELEETCTPILSPNLFIDEDEVDAGTSRFELPFQVPRSQTSSIQTQCWSKPPSIISSVPEPRLHDLKSYVYIETEAFSSPNQTNILVNIKLMSRTSFGMGSGMFEWFFSLPFPFSGDRTNGLSGSIFAVIDIACVKISKINTQMVAGFYPFQQNFLVDNLRSLRQYMGYLGSKSVIPNGLNFYFGIPYLIRDAGATIWAFMVGSRDVTDSTQISSQPYIGV